MKIWYYNPSNLMDDDRLHDLKFFGYDHYLARGWNPINKVNIRETHTMVYEFCDEYSEFAENRNDFENIFTMFQGEFMEPNKAKFIGNVSGSHTSMSVGDIIETRNGSLYIVEPCGFMPLQIQE